MLIFVKKIEVILSLHCHNPTLTLTLTPDIETYVRNTKFIKITSHKDGNRSRTINPQKRKQQKSQFVVIPITPKSGEPIS